MLSTKQDLTIQYLPMYTDMVPAGFPSPASDYEEDELDLNELLIRRPAATYFLRVTGESMKEAGILPNDIIVVDRSLRAVSGHIVVAALNGEFTIKTLQMEGGRVVLHPENSAYRDIVVGREEDFSVFGVVTGVVRKMGKPGS